MAIPFPVTIASSALFLLLPQRIFPQTFTRITTGSLVNDGGASRAVNWVDINNDGYLDLFVSNGLEGGQDNVLYINNGPDSNYSFQKVSVSPIVADHMPSDGSSWGDFDNDGDLDVVVVAWYDSSNSFYTNNGNGTFVQVSSSPIIADRGYSETCSWGDYDNDGFLDLSVANSGSPSLGAKVNFLYHNNGDGTLTKIVSGDIVTDAKFSRNVSWIDFDNDGDMDLFVANERGQNNDLYRNMLTESGLPTFTCITTGPVVTGGGNSFSASWADVDNDGDLDLYVANGWPTGQRNSFYLNNGDGTFASVSNDTIVGTTGFHFGSMWGDYDNDGDLDLFVTTAYGSAASRNILYTNMLIETGTLRFERVGEGSIVNDIGHSYACAWGDYDRDGDLDVFVTKTLNENENNVLYRNDNLNGNHWLEVRCVGTQSNLSGIGTKVRVRAFMYGHHVWQMREVDGQSGNCSENLEQHFGIGDASVIDSMIIEWPGGAVDTYSGVAVDRIVVAREGTGLTGARWQEEQDVPHLTLLQNYPNPFNPATSIPFAIPARGFVTLTIYDILGRNIVTLVDGNLQPGSYTTTWNAVGVASGIYFCRLQTEKLSRTRKLVLVR